MARTTVVARIVEASGASWERGEKLLNSVGVAIRELLRDGEVVNIPGVGALVPEADRTIVFRPAQSLASYLRASHAEAERMDLLATSEPCLGSEETVSSRVYVEMGGRRLVGLWDVRRRGVGIVLVSRDRRNHALSYLYAVMGEWFAVLRDGRRIAWTPA